MKSNPKYDLLDKILTDLSKGDTLYFRKDFDIYEKSYTDVLSYDAFKLYIAELVRTNYAESNNYAANPSSRITLQGLLFLERGGYNQSLKSSRSANQVRYRSKLLLTTSTISVMFLTTITTWVQCSDSQSNKASIEKKIKSLNNKVDSLQNELDQTYIERESNKRTQKSPSENRTGFKE